MEEGVEERTPDPLPHSDQWIVMVARGGEERNKIALLSWLVRYIRRLGTCRKGAELFIEHTEER